jgi:sialic acid synthase SpsE
MANEENEENWDLKLICIYMYICFSNMRSSVTNENIQISFEFTQAELFNYCYDLGNYFCLSPYSNTHFRFIKEMSCL